jgi:selT/selW/selH-like putative selenoprotein
LAASLDSKFGEAAQIRPGKSGQFDVLVNGKLVFSKASAGRFPVDGEVEEIFAALKEGREPKPVEVKRPEGFIARALGKLRN